MAVDTKLGDVGSLQGLEIVGKSWISSILTLVHHDHHVHDLCGMLEGNHVKKNPTQTKTPVVQQSMIEYSPSPSRGDPQETHK